MKTWIQIPRTHKAGHSTGLYAMCSFREVGGQKRENLEKYMGQSAWLCNDKQLQT